MGLCSFHETFSITEKKTIFQLLVRNKDPFIKLETTLSGHLSLNTKTFAFSNVFLATNDRHESFKKNYPGGRRSEYVQQINIITYVYIVDTKSYNLVYNSVILDKWQQLQFLIFTFLISILTMVYYVIY